MLPALKSPSQKEAGISSAWDRYAFAKFQRIGIILILGILIFEVAILFAFKQISFMQFLLVACVFLFVLIFHALILIRLYSEQPEQLSSCTRFGLPNEQIISRITTPDTPPPRFST